MKISTFLVHITDAARQRNCTPEEIATQCVNAGITGVDILSSDLSSERRKQLCRVLSRGMVVNSYAVSTDFVHQATDEAIDAVLEDALSIGAKTMLVIPGFLQENDDAEACIARSVEAIAELCRRAEPYGVRIGMEDFDYFRSPVAKTAGLARYLNEIPALSCLFDTGNFQYSCEDAWSAYETLKGRIDRQVHCKDRSLEACECEHFSTAVDGTKLYPVAVGDGMIPIAEILFDLRKNGFDGWLTIEHFGSADQLRDLLASAEALKKMIEA